MKSNKKGKETDTMSSSGFPRDFTRTPDLSQIGLSGFPTSPIEIRKNTDITVISGYSNVLSQNGSRRNTRELNASLMERLAHGQKQKVRLHLIIFFNLIVIKKRNGCINS